MAPKFRDWNKRYVDGDTPWDTGIPEPEMRRLLEQFNIGSARVLELGCGTGTDAIQLARRGFDVSAVDLSQQAIDRARRKAAEAGVAVDFRVADLVELPDLGGPFPLVFDRGVYHVMRRANLFGFLTTLDRVTEPGGHYMTFAGNANQQVEGEEGPPRVHAAELCGELAPLFELVQLTECHFQGVVTDGKEREVLAWSALLRRK